MATKILLTRIFLTFVILLTLESCNRSKETSVVFVNSFVSDSLINKTQLELEIINENDCLNYIYTYYDSKKTKYSIFKACELSAYYNNVECSLVKIEEYLIENGSYEILTYLFDEENSVDEELILFFNKDYGLIMEYSKHWNLSKTFISDETTQELISQIELNYIIKPPEPARNN